MHQNSIRIEYSNPQAVFYPGTNVDGVVHLELKESIKVLQAGIYRFPFLFTLPLKCAPSFEGFYGYIRYMVKVVLDRPWRFNKTDKRLFTVVPMLDLNLMPEVAVPVREVTVKNLGVVLFRHGKVTVEWEITKRGYVPGEAVVVNAVVKNDTSKNFVKATMKLLEISKYVAYEHSCTFHQESFRRNECGHNSREQRRKLATGEQDICIEKKSEGNVQLYLQVPPTVPTFNSCAIISVEYIVEVKFKTMSTFNGDIESCFPITVGTVPVNNAKYFTQPTAANLDMPCTSSVAPTAPPLEISSSYATWSGTNVHPPPPPSYEESINGVAGTTLDTDNMEVLFLIMAVYKLRQNLIPFSKPCYHGDFSVIHTTIPFLFDIMWRGEKRL
uniref:Arrestin_C domain-containing protein n=1 Tax=Angiostrongylus cantonensis TaxID=6313 RepID=A0A0K0CZB8_ANGCA